MTIKYVRRVLPPEERTVYWVGVLRLDCARPDTPVALFASDEMAWGWIRTQAGNYTTREFRALVVEPDATPRTEGPMSKLDLYQAWTRTTALYPGSGGGGPEAIVYCALGLAGETGELAGALDALAKADTPENEAAVFAELGDVTWYFARLLAETGFVLSQAFGGEGDPVGDVRLAAHETPWDTYFGLAVAVGRVVERVKKTIRDHGGLPALATVLREPASRDTHPAKLFLDAVQRDLAPAYARMVAVLGGKVFDVCAANEAKLTARMARNTLQGSGDKR